MVITVHALAHFARHHPPNKCIWIFVTANTDLCESKSTALTCQHHCQLDQGRLVCHAIGEWQHKVIPFGK